MRIVVRVATDTGWLTYPGDVPNGSDQECYVLPKINGESQCRAAYWSRKMGVQIPAGRSLVWHVLDNWLCHDCEVDTVAIGEYYMVNDCLWLSAGMKIGAANGMLCIGCLESRLGRLLNPKDFRPLLLNGAPGRSVRFISRHDNGANC